MSNFVKIEESYVNPAAIAWVSPAISGLKNGLMLHYVYSTHGRPYVESVSAQDVGTVFDVLANVKGMLSASEWLDRKLKQHREGELSKQHPYRPKFVSKFGPGMSFDKPSEEPLEELVAQVRFTMTTTHPNASEPVLHTFSGSDAETLRSAFEGSAGRAVDEQASNPRQQKREAVKCG